MQLTCPECKNDVDLSPYGELAKDQIIECQTCGITLGVTSLSNDAIEVEIVDEGK